MNWLEVCEDKRLQNLPYKIELNRWGKIEMSPHRREHSLFQGEIAYLLRNLLPHGVALSECAIETTENVKVADVAWASRQRWESMADRVSCSVAPLKSVWKSFRPRTHRRKWTGKGSFISRPVRSRAGCVMRAGRCVFPIRAVSWLVPICAPLSLIRSKSNSPLVSRGTGPDISRRQVAVTEASPHGKNAGS